MARVDEVAICNTAIGMCGSTDFIQSLTDKNSVSARRCNVFFPIAVKKVLRKHDWNCATAIQLLARNTADPIFKYRYSYNLPSDCVRVVNVYGDFDGYNPYDRWEIRNRMIHTDLETVYLEYVAYPNNYRDLDILLADAIAGELALMLAATLVTDPEKFSSLVSFCKMKFSEAAAIDTLEDKFINKEASVWNDARNMGVDT